MTKIQNWISQILNFLAGVFSRKSEKNSSNELTPLGDGKFNPAIVLTDTMDSVGFQLAKLNIDPEDVTDIKSLLMIQLEVRKQECLWVLSESVAGMTENEVILTLAARLVINKKLSLEEISAKIQELVANNKAFASNEANYDIRSGQYELDGVKSVTSYKGASVISKPMSEIVNSAKESKDTNIDLESSGEKEEDLATKLSKLWSQDIKENDSSDTTNEDT